VELKARLHAKVKKLHRDQAKSSSMIFGLLQIDLSRQLVFDLSDNKRAIPFTSREFKLLVFLARNENNVLSREQLLDAVWGNASSVFDRTVDTHISAIRKKLGNLAGYIDSVKGSGYRFCGPAQIRKSA
jgi:DNA-binding response OmpR family regulator